LSLLVGCNPNIQDIDGDTPLHTCDQPSIAQLLISSKADPLVRNNLGKTMLDQAIELENDEMVEFWQSRLNLQNLPCVDANTIPKPIV
jgi:ankyrin repeat protein